VAFKLALYHDQLGIEPTHLRENFLSRALLNCLVYGFARDSQPRRNFPAMPAKNGGS